VPFEPPGDDPKQRRRPGLVSLRTGADGEMIGPLDLDAAIARWGQDQATGAAAGSPT